MNTNTKFYGDGRTPRELKTQIEELSHKRLNAWFKLAPTNFLYSAVSKLQHKLVTSELRKRNKEA
jgi:hypothetical protein